MARSAIDIARTATTTRQRVVPVGLKGGSSLWFDGIDDRVTGSNPFAGASPITIAAWIRPNTIPDASFRTAVCVGSLLGGGGTQGCILTVTNGNLWASGMFAVARTMGAAQQKPLCGKWSRVVMSHSGAAGANFGLYVDAVASTAGAAAGTPNFTGAASYIGVGAVATWPSKSNICDVRVYSRVWTPMEVIKDFSGEWVDPTGLVRWWKLEDGAGGTAREEIVGTNDAITGAIWSTEAPFSARSASGARTAA